MADQVVSTIKVFYCYAHEDDALREQLAKHLSPLQRLRQITGWFDRDIQAGTDWDQEIETQFDTASIILLLISADFIASDYCYTVEMERALVKHQMGVASVIPIILRPVHWEDTPIGTLRALPTGHLPVTKWANQDDAWLDVVQGIHETVRNLLAKQTLSHQETGILYPEQANQQFQHQIAHSSTSTSSILSPYSKRPLFKQAHSLNNIVPSTKYKSGLSRGKSVLFIVLAFLIILSGTIGFFYYYVSNNTAKPNIQANAIAAVSAYSKTTNIQGVMFGFDARNTRYNPYEKIITPTNVSSLVQSWKSFTGSITSSSPAIADGTVYIGSGESPELYAFNATSGALLWTGNIGRYTESSPAVAYGVVYIGSYDGKLYAFNAKSGVLLWTATTGNAITSSPTVADGVVYIGSEDGKLYAFDAKKGTTLWTATTKKIIYRSSPAVADGVVYIGSDDHYLYAINAGTGAVLWKGPTADNVDSSPAVFDGVVYVGSHDGKLYAFDAKKGTTLWTETVINASSNKINPNDPFTSSPAIADGKVYIGSLDHKLYAFSAKTGKMLWATSTENIIEASPTVANGVVYVTQFSGKLYAFKADTGKVLWTGNILNSEDSSPAVANGTIYVGSFSDYLYAFHLPHFTY